MTAHNVTLGNLGARHRPPLQRMICALAFVTTYGHNEVMKSAKVSELKAKLSAYLSEVRSGGSIIVYDRNTPIARLVPFHDEPDDLTIVDASAHPSTLKKIKGVRPRRKIDIDKVLRELRGVR